MRIFSRSTRLIALICVTISQIDLGLSQAVLDCNFEVDFCNWAQGANGVEDDFDWGRSNRVMVDGFHSIPRSVTGTGYFAYAQGSLRTTTFQGAKTWLISPVIQNQINPGILDFVYWKTAAPPILQVCIRDVGGAGPMQCVDTISGLGDQAWVRRQVTIPSRALNFQIVLQATNFNSPTDLLGIDDLRYRNGAAQYDQSSQSEQRLGDEERLFMANINRAGGGFPFPISALGKIQVGSTGNNVKIPPRAPPPQTIPRPPGTSTGNSQTRGFPPPNPTPSNPTPKSYLFPPTPPPIRTTPQYPYEPNSGIIPGLPQRRLPHEPINPERVPEDRIKQGRLPPGPIPPDFIPPGNGYNGRTPPSTRPHQPGSSSRPGACPAVACTFDHGLCQWFNDLKANFDYKIKNRDSPFSGIPQDFSNRDSYIYVSGNTRTPEQRGTIRSPAFIVPTGAYLQFDAFISDSQRGRLSLYRNDPYRSINVLWAALGNIALDGPGWHKITVPLPQGSTQPIALNFVADQLANGVHVGIDGIVLVDSEGREIGCASDTAFVSREVNEIRKFITDPENTRLVDPDNFVVKNYGKPPWTPRFYSGVSAHSNILGDNLTIKDQSTLSNYSKEQYETESNATARPSTTAGNLVSFDRITGYYHTNPTEYRRPIIRAIGPTIQDPIPTLQDPGKDATLDWVLESLPNLIALPFASRKDKDKVKNIKKLLANSLTQKLQDATEKMQQLKAQKLRTSYSTPEFDGINGRLSSTHFDPNGQWWPVVNTNQFNDEMMVKPMKVKQSPVNQVLAPQTGYPLLSTGGTFENFIKTLTRGRNNSDLWYH